MDTLLKISLITSYWATFPFPSHTVQWKNLKYRVNLEAIATPTYFLLLKPLFHVE